MLPRCQPSAQPCSTHPQVARGHRSTLLDAQRGERPLFALVTSSQVARYVAGMHVSDRDEGDWIESRSAPRRRSTADLDGPVRHRSIDPCDSCGWQRARLDTVDDAPRHSGIADGLALGTVLGGDSRASWIRGPRRGRRPLGRPLGPRTAPLKAVGALDEYAVCQLPPLGRFEQRKPAIRRPRHLPREPRGVSRASEPWSRCCRSRPSPPITTCDPPGPLSFPSAGARSRTRHAGESGPDRAGVSTRPPTMSRKRRRPAPADAGSRPSY